MRGSPTSGPAVLRERETQHPRHLNWAEAEPIAVDGWVLDQGRART